MRPRSPPPRPETRPTSGPTSNPKPSSRATSRFSSRSFRRQTLSAPEDNQQQVSKIAPSEAEFRQLIGDDNEGTLARFVDNKLSVLFWYRPPLSPDYVFGAQIALPRLARELQSGGPGSRACAARGDLCRAAG